LSGFGVGIVGLGVISRYYLAALDRMPGLRLAAVCDVDEVALAPFQGRVACFEDHRRLLERADLDAVIVNVPNDVHFEVCRDALLAGRAVCVEKPLATAPEQGRELVRLAERLAVPLFTAFHRRYNRGVLALLEATRAAAPVREVTVRYLERIEDHVGRDRWYLDPARCGGGCVADNGPNAFDLVRLFVGEVEVEAAEVRRDAAGVDRQAAVGLRGARGVCARVELDWSFEGGERKDVAVRHADGSGALADMLDGFSEFKGSLWHEYVGVLEDFRSVLTTREDRSRDGLAALELVHATYGAAR
jgi:predicted dehydrogenase